MTFARVKPVRAKIIVGGSTTEQMHF